ncbi:hypothetical protein Glove_493g39 [Diversispora epigaea]|uniref:Uncharacterized protein n=1 Tax=Diversispora epigaea TaxID=1348612 RepID=A0A397GI89_9GLOM|nr:hypothetical protein Glove_493g39 [Diversispora epigaea]
MVDINATRMAYQRLNLNRMISNKNWINEYITRVIYPLRNNCDGRKRDDGIKSTIVDVNAPDTEMTNALEPPETTKIGDNASDIKMMTTIDDDALEPNTTKDDVDASELSTTAVDGNTSDTEMTPIVDATADDNASPKKRNLLMMLSIQKPQKLIIKKLDEVRSKDPTVYDYNDDNQNTENTNDKINIQTATE